MALGHFSHLAQPEDGVAQMWGVVGANEQAAIMYGYETWAKHSGSEAVALEPSGERERLHYAEMAVQTTRLLQIGMA